ncbi:MAG: hypothetical protein IKB98_07810 [Clostridia bacterium]|nr:hypothetical protein [Clostridia bacterium]
MVKIWAKVMLKDKIVKQFTYEREGAMDYSLFFDYVKDICEALDIPTPVIIKTHLFNYAKYNVLRFKKDDFVESINFDKLVLENIFI